MAYAESLQAELANWRPGPGRHSWSKQVGDTPWSVCVTADQCDALSCLVWEVSFTRPPGADSSGSLTRWAQRIADRVTVLSEKLTVHEVDQHLGTALVRGAQPVKRGERVSYFEAELAGPDKVTFRRFQASTQPGVRREQVTFPLTYEAIVRLAEQVTEA